MELASPTIQDAVYKCAEAGCTSVVVAPYFLSHGRHIQEDIPALVQAAQEAFPHLPCAIAEPIGASSREDAAGLSSTWDRHGWVGLEMLVTGAFT